MFDYQSVCHCSKTDQNNERMKQINLDHWHMKERSHVHRGYYHYEYDPGEKRLSLSKREQVMVERVQKIWENRKGRK